MVNLSLHHPWVFSGWNGRRLYAGRNTIYVQLQFHFQACNEKGLNQKSFVTSSTRSSATERRHRRGEQTRTLHLNVSEDFRLCSPLTQQPEVFKLLEGTPSVALEVSDLQSLLEREFSMLRVTASVPVVQSRGPRRRLSPQWTRETP